MVVDFVFTGRRGLGRVARVDALQDAQASEVLQRELQPPQNRAARHVGRVDARLALFADLAEPC